MPDTALAQTLEAVRTKIAKAASRASIDEQNTKVWLVEPVLEALGWDVRDIDEVRREYKVERRDGPVDYALAVDGTVRVVVEAKALREDVNDRRWWIQVAQYAVACGARWMVLTNGDAYQVFVTHESVPIDKKLIRTFKVSDKAADAERMLALLAKDRVRENRLDDIWRRQHVESRVEAALRDLLSPQSSGEILRSIARRVKDLPAAELRKAYAKARIEVSFAPVFDLEDETRAKRPSLRLAKGPGGARTLAKDARSERDGSGASKRKRVVVEGTLADLIAAGVVTTPLEVFADYRGKRIVARVESDAQVVLDGTHYDSLSAAGSAARAKSLGSKAKGMVINTNGWTFWKFAGSEGKSREIGELREDWIAKRERSEPSSAAKG